MEYDRLAPLVPLNYSLNGSFAAVRPGDCLVAFSRSDVYQIRKQIELVTRQPCALVYGALPAGMEGLFNCMYIAFVVHQCLVMRNQQAEAFNSLSSCKTLAATDCIGMGLNLLAYYLRIIQLSLSQLCFLLFPYFDLILVRSSVLYSTSL